MELAFVGIGFAVAACALIFEVASRVRVGRGTCRDQHLIKGFRDCETTAVSEGDSGSGLAFVARIEAAYCLDVDANRESSFPAIFALDLSQIDKLSHVV